MRNLNSTKQADDFIADLPPKQFKQVYTKITSLKKNPMPHDTEKIKGFENTYRTDIGEYRIIYSFDKDTIYIKAVGKRNDGEVYRKL